MGTQHDLWPYCVEIKGLNSFCFSAHSRGFITARLCWHMKENLDLQQTCSLFSCRLCFQSLCWNILNTCWGLNQTKSDSIRLNQTLTEGKSLCISLNDKLLSLYLKTCLHDNRWRSVRERKLPQHQRSHRQRHRDCQDPVISTNTVKCICGKNAPEPSFRLGLLPRAVTQNSGAMVTESLWAPFTSFIQLCGQLHWLLGHERLTADRSVACPWVSAHFDLLCFYHRAVHSLTTVTRVLLGLLSWRMNSFLCFHWIFYDSCEIKSSKNVKSVF